MSALMSPQERLIKIIAERHGILIGRDDPIMILHTLNEVLQDENKRAQSEALKAFESSLEQMSDRWGKSSKDMAERTLAAALNASQEALSKNMVTSSKVVATAVKKQMDDSTEELKKSIQDGKRIARFNVMAAGLAVAASTIALLAML